ncbi:hypothetical protein [Aquimarina longa]|uniref:hypothetical protein n=1 Tax=Aquimarina longa TaxID=1080221 RepID=UPI000783763A|nr:hypothetical protein [Aquimarina longa]
MTLITTTIKELIDPDFRCEILNREVAIKPYTCYTFTSKYNDELAIGGVKECLHSICKIIIQNYSKYNFPVSIQIFSEKTGELLWRGTIQ